MCIIISNLYLNSITHFIFIITFGSLHFHLVVSFLAYTLKCEEVTHRNEIDERMLARWFCYLDCFMIVISHMILYRKIHILINIYYTSRRIDVRMLSEKINVYDSNKSRFHAKNCNLTSNGSHERIYMFFLYTCV